MASSGDSRLHALDGLRAAMMLLGLVLHSAVSYTVTPLQDAWPYQDRSTSVLFDILTFIIHLFRMPVFFIMAGFFAALLYFREGGRGFLANRARRVLLPLIAAWIVVFPLIRAGFVFASSGGGDAGWAAASDRLGSAPYRDARLGHLWFLYDLFIFYLAAFVLAPVLLRAAPRTMRSIADAFARHASGVVGLLACSFVTALTLLPMKLPALETSFSLLPPLRILVAYGVFFTYGWLLFSRREVLSAYAKRSWLWLVLAVVMSIAYMALTLSLAPGARAPVMTYAVAAAAIWIWAYAIIGLFLRYAAAPRPLQRYMADGAYWIYLIHLPFTIWIPGLLAPLAMPAIGKFLIVIAGTTFVTVVTYHFLVRSTFIGAVLNGRRYPRALPPPASLPIAKMPVGGLEIELVKRD